MGKTGLSAWVAVATLLCVGCVKSGPSFPDAPFKPSQCSTKAFQYLIGQPATQIDRSRLPAAHRIVCHECAATMDFNPNRLTIQLGPDDQVVSARCE